MKDKTEEQKLGEEGKFEDKEERQSDFLICTTPAALLRLLIDTNTSSKHYPTFNNSPRSLQSDSSPQIHLN